MLGLAIRCALAQTNLALGVQLYAGLSITGAVGTICEIQYVTNLTQTNGWLWLTNLTLVSSPQLWVDTACPATGERFYRAVVTSQALAGLVLIPPGPFVMGNCMSPSEGWSDELPLHTNYMSGFYMDAHEVSKTQWDEVYQWAVSHGYRFDNPGSDKETNHPVQTVNWYDTVKWCNARSEKAGLMPCYYTDASQTTVYRSGQRDLSNDCVNWTAGYRLPTEAEWEKAARGGTAGHRFPWSDVDTISHSRANYWAGTDKSYDLSYPAGYPPAYAVGLFPYTSPVGSFAPNGYGLYDMAGNVLEWCWDWYDSQYYSGSPATDPQGPDGILSYRVLRGASWDHLVWDCRCSFRYDGTTPDTAYFYIGFRCVKAL